VPILCQAQQKHKISTDWHKTSTKDAQLILCLFCAWHRTGTNQAQLYMSEKSEQKGCTNEAQKRHRISTTLEDGHKTHFVHFLCLAQNRHKTGTSLYVWKEWTQTSTKEHKRAQKGTLPNNYRNEHKQAQQSTNLFCAYSVPILYHFCACFGLKFLKLHHISIIYTNFVPTLCLLCAYFVRSLCSCLCQVCAYSVLFFPPVLHYSAWAFDTSYYVAGSMISLRNY
jgi:hypothetical protein